MATVPKISFPVPANATGTEFGSSDALLDVLNGESSGLYLVGSQGMWHGGVHITNATVPWCALTGKNASELAYVHTPYKGEQAVRGMADGEIVAYRACQDYDFIEWGNDKLYFSSSFVLVKHAIQPDENAEHGLTFHTLYMNLAPVSSYAQTDGDLRKTAKSQNYYATSADVQSNHSAGTLPVNTQVRLGEQVVTSESKHRQYGEVTVMADTGALKAGDKVWTVSDQGWLKPASEQGAAVPSWWNKCSPALHPGTVNAPLYKTSAGLKYYLSSADTEAGIHADTKAGSLENGFPVFYDANNTALQFTRSDGRIFSLVTLGKDVAPQKKGDRVWVVSGSDNLVSDSAGAPAGQAAYGQVVNLTTPIKIAAGDSIGHLGFYELPQDNGKLSRYQVHIECLSMDPQLPTFLTNPGNVGRDDPAYLSYPEGAVLMMPDAQGKMAATDRKTRAPGILTRSKVPGVDAEGHVLTDNKGAEQYQIHPEGGWLAKGDVKQLSPYDLAGLGFMTLDKAPESFDLIDGIHHPDNVVKGILEQLYKAAQDETRSSHAMNQYNYKRLLELIDKNEDGHYSEEEYLQAIHNPSYRSHLYRLIVKHPSEWYYGKEDPFWKGYLDTLTTDAPLWKAYTESFIEKMAWMKQVEGMGPEPWHMHPVVFLEALSCNDEMDPKWLKVPKGQLTFDCEGNDREGSIYFSRHPHVPNNHGVVIGASGVTFGRGLDFGQQTRTYIEQLFSEMETHARPLSPTMKEWLLGSVSKKRTESLDYCNDIDSHVVKSEQYLTRKQQHFLFNAVYQHLYDTTKRVLSRGEVINDVRITANLDTFEQDVQDVLVDLTFRGDNSSRTRKYFLNDLQQSRSRFIENISSNDWVSVFGVPAQRFNSRKDYL